MLRGPHKPKSWIVTRTRSHNLVQIQPPLPILRTVTMLTEAHPNKRYFEGILTVIGVVSTRTPKGTNGKKVILTESGTIKALPTLEGTPVNCNYDFRSHNAERPVGIINFGSLEVKDDITYVKVYGYIFAVNFPLVVRELEDHSSRLGMSYEIVNVQTEIYEDLDILIVKDFTFSGAAIGLKETAAYEGTSIHLVNDYHDFQFTQNHTILNSKDMGMETYNTVDLNASSSVWGNLRK